MAVQFRHDSPVHLFSTQVSYCSNDAHAVLGISAVSHSGSYVYKPCEPDGTSGLTHGHLSARLLDEDYNRSRYLIFSPDTKCGTG